MKKKEIINLIRAHYDCDDNLFRKTSNDVARSFDEEGDYQLAQYVMSLISNVNMFKPQSISFESQFFKKIALDSPSLFLPIPIMADIKGIMNAVNHHVGINKFLFEGAPGTGKTESAKQVARLLQRSLYSVDFNEIIDSKMGQTAKNISIVFNEINRMPHPDKVVILFDEIDVIALDRVNTNDIREMGRATSNILKALDNVNEEVVIIATTNLYKQLDKAFQRRFDSIVNFDRYSKTDLVDDIGVGILNNYLKNFTKVSRDTKLFKKILNTCPVLPNPGELKNLIKVSLAFSNPDAHFDYLIRLYQSLNKQNQDLDPIKLKRQGFTVREIGILKNISKSQAARMLKEKMDE